MIEWVRPVLSIIGFLAITYGFLTKMVDQAAYLGLVTGIVIWWFKSRDDEKKNGGIK